MVSTIIFFMGGFLQTVGLLVEASTNQVLEYGHSSGWLKSQNCEWQSLSIRYDKMVL